MEQGNEKELYPDEIWVDDLRGHPSIFGDTHIFSAEYFMRGMAHIVRHNGYARADGKNVSVLKHTLLVHRITDRILHELGVAPSARVHILRYALLHDASEVWFGDIARPIKKHSPEIKHLEDSFIKKIMRANALTIENPESVQGADVLAWGVERRYLKVPLHRSTECEFPYVKQLNIDPRLLYHTCSDILNEESTETLFVWWRAAFADTFLVPKIVGLAGPPGSGKDTLGRYLRDYLLYDIVKFADPIKHALQTLFPWNERLWEDREWKETKQSVSGTDLKISPRSAAQTLGTEWGRHTVSEDLWVDLFRNRLLRQTHRRPTVVTDVRFPNEAEAIRALGGVIVYLDDYYSEGSRSHESESHLKTLRRGADRVVHTKNVSPEQSAEKLMRFVKPAMGLLTLKDMRGK